MAPSPINQPPNRQLGDRIGVISRTQEGDSGTMQHVVVIVAAAVVVELRDELLKMLRKKI